MNKIQLINTRSNLASLFHLMIICLFLGLFIRNIGLMPFVFQDETVYSFDSRLKPLADASIPNILFLKVYSYTNFCNSAYLDCARLFNLVFYFIASALIFLIARKFVSTSTAAWVSVISLVAPLNTYTAFFMPEAMYYCFYWFFIFTLVYARNVLSMRCWLLVSTVLAICSLIKPHAIFLLLPVTVFFFYLAWKRQLIFKNTIILLGTIFASFFLLRFLLVFWISGHLSWFHLGSEYSSLAAETSVAQMNLSIRQLFTNMFNSLLSFSYHFLFVFLIFSFPIGYSLTKYKTEINNNSEASISLMEFVVLNFLSIIVLIAMTAAFTGVVFESSFPFFLRYYSFAFPMFYILAACAFEDQETDQVNWQFKTIFVFSIFCVTLVALITHLSFVRISYLEGPEIRGLVRVKSYFYVFCSLNLVAAVLFLKRTKSANVFYFTVLLPYMLIYSSIVMNIDIRTRTSPNPYDQAGIFAKQYFETHPVNGVLVLAPYKSGLLRTVFHLDRTDVDYITIDRSENLDLNKNLNNSRINNVEGIVLIDSDSIEPNANFQKIDMLNFSIFRRLGEE